MSNIQNFKPTSISWHNINVFTKYSPKFYERNKTVAQKQLLKGVSGEVKAGHFLAVMGSSGAGKTTLLNVLTARNLSEVSVKGVVKLNGQLANAVDIKLVSAYVQQHDLFIPYLTVREHLNFQASLRLDQGLTKQERHTRVEEVINELSLTKCSETRIGSNTTFKGISGGESKRLAFASELLTDPALLFCDEPTSGLDSFMAANVVNVMKSMASKGRTVICTIHQPSSRVFQLFDELLLIADGRVAYMGHRDEALYFFSSLDLHISRNYNPADFYIKELSIIPGEEIKCIDKINKICDQFKNNGYKNEIIAETTKLSSTQSFNPSDSNDMHSSSRLKASFWRQISNLIFRTFLENSRDPQVFKSNVIETIIGSLVVGVVYYDQKLTQSGVTNIAGAFFLFQMTIAMTLLLSVIYPFTYGFPLLIREYKNNMYGVLSYFIAITIVQIPLLTIVPILFTSINYYMINLNPDGAVFILHMVLLILLGFCSASWGYLLSSTTDSIQIVSALMVPTNVILSTLGGFVLNTSTFPDWLSWAKYISLYHYSFEGLIINQWRDIDYIPCDQLTECLSNGTEIISYYGFNEKDFVLDFVILIVMSFVLLLMAFTSLYIRVIRVK